MKRTPFYEFHKQLNAKMCPFPGYEMPISYGSIAAEHLNVRQNVGIFDVSHMGEFIVKGKNALNFIQRFSSNDASKLTAGKVQYSCILNENGGIVDDMLVYALPDGTYMLVVNGANVAKDWAYLQQFLPEQDIEFIDISEKTALLAIQGPNAATVLQPLTDMNLGDMTYYTCQKGVFAGVEKVLVSSTGYTGAGGFEVYFYAENAEHIWNSIMQAGRKVGLMPTGLAARDTLRLEKGFCLYGNDIDDNTTPLEAGLGWITKTHKKNLVARDILLAQKKAGVSKKLCGLTILDRGIARTGYEVVDENGEKIGTVTSGTQSPSLNKAIAMAYIATEKAVLGTEVFVKIRKKTVKAEIVKLPFL